MSHLLQWNIAAVPTRAWAMQVFPNLEPDDAINRLWEVILSVVRADAPDPLAAWQQHDQQLSLFAAYLKQSGVRALHFLDSQPGPDSKPRTDLMVGLSDAPVWIAASTSTPAGVRFLPNIPTEELFTTPHRERVDGWMRTTKPAFPFGQRIDDIYLRFEKGAVVEFDAASGRNALQEFLSAPGADRPGEIALVDVRSPVNRSGLLFYETLLDENCVAHIALGMAYPDGVEHGSSMMEHERTAAGINDAMVHLDLMIGSATMDVSGVTMAGAHLPIMHNGQFVDALLQTSQTAHA
jgi:aminopeptidase